MLYITLGISGCGKSYFADKLVKENPNLKNVNRDSFRFMLDNYSYQPKLEASITKIHRFAVDTLLKTGYDVIVSDTNLSYIDKLAKIGYENGHDVNVYLFDVPFEVCKQRIHIRVASGGLFIPDEVLEKQYDKYLSIKDRVQKDFSCIVIKD